MKITQILTVLLMLAIGAAMVTSEGGCAVIIPPTGGPRDTLPPMAMSITPGDSTRNFDTKKIVFTFNEYVQLDNPQQNMLVSPVPKINPISTAKLRTITIEIKDTLEPNTTYSINFGKAIKDINEGNILKDFTYLFTTGNTLDSFALSGKVTVAETGKYDSTLIVMLHRNMDDSAVIRERPRYFARVNKMGDFQFRNLAEGTYAIYALKDEGARRYLSKEQFFGFADSSVTSQSMRNDIMLYAYTEKPKTKAGSPSTISAPSKSKKPSRADNALKLQSNLTSGQLDLLANLVISVAEDPLLSFDSTKILLMNDSFELVTGYSFQRDTSNRKITVVYPWKENTGYNLMLDTAFAEDTMGRKLLRNDTIAFRTKKKEEYGEMSLRFRNLPLEKNPVLQFLQGDQVKFSHVFTNSNFNAPLFVPGEYDLRLVFDDNQNGEWDAGEFFVEHRQPEKVLLISRKINVKPNWKVEVDIQL